MGHHVVDRTAGELGVGGRQHPVGQDGGGESGDVVGADVVPAGQGGRGELNAGALEMSNVDLSEEFTGLIVAQRGFQANSRVISSSDEVLQDLVNLKR